MPRPRIARYLSQHNNGRWYIQPDGISTRTSDRAAAELELDRYEAGVANPLPPNAPTLNDILRGYEKDRKGRVASHQTVHYSGKALMSVIGSLRPHELSQGLIDEYPEKRQRANGSIQRELVTLRAALRWAIRHGWFKDEPRFVMPVKASKPRERWLSKEECERLLEHASEHVRLFIILALGTGARSRAILDLKWTQQHEDDGFIDFDSGLIHYGRGSGNKRRAIVPINARVRSALMDAVEVRTTDYVIEMDGHAPIKSIKTGFRAACRRAKVTDATPHTLRHTCATQAIMAGTPITEVAKLLGDTVDVVEKVYGKHSPDYLKNAVSWFS